MEELDLSATGHRPLSEEGSTSLCGELAGAQNPVSIYTCFCSFEPNNGSLNFLYHE